MVNPFFSSLIISSLLFQIALAKGGGGGKPSSSSSKPKSSSPNSSSGSKVSHTTVITGGHTICYNQYNYQIPCPVNTPKIIGIVIGSLVGALVISLLIYYLWWRPRRSKPTAWARQEPPGGPASWIKMIRNTTPVVREMHIANNSGLGTEHKRILVPSSPASQSAPLMREEDKHEDP